MAWFLQTPDGASPKLLGKILTELGPAVSGGAAYAFASAQGVKLLGAEPVFQKFLKASRFLMVVGLDAITDPRAIDELRKLKKNHPNFIPKLFLHKTAGSLFHPKTLWLRTQKGGVIITGSGNLTSGGLNSNWEAMAIETLTSLQIKDAESNWNAWLENHSDDLVDLDNPEALAKAEVNKRLRIKLKRALNGSIPGAEGGDAEIEILEPVSEEIEQELLLNPVLIAEVPKSGDRWKQVNFDVQTYQQFFGVTLGSRKNVEFRPVNNDGSLGPAEYRHAVAVKSQNYRFEVGAAHGLPYPTRGHPIVIFEKITKSKFKYILLMPQQPEHKLIQDYINNNFAKSNGKQRIVVTLGDLQKAWPACPFFY